MQRCTSQVLTAISECWNPLFISTNIVLLQDFHYPSPLNRILLTTTGCFHTHSSIIHPHLDLSSNIFPLQYWSHHHFCSMLHMHSSVFIHPRWLFLYAILLMRLFISRSSHVACNSNLSSQSFNFHNIHSYSFKPCIYAPLNSVGTLIP